MASIYLGLQTDGEFFIRSSMFACGKKTLKFVNYHLNQIQKQCLKIHLLLLTTISFEAPLDSTFSHIQITQEIVKPEKVFTRPLLYTKITQQNPIIQIKLV